FKGTMPSLPFKALIQVVGVIAASAQAQLLPTWETHITLTQQDIDMIRGAVTNEVHGKPVGTKAHWTNPASGNSGTMKLVKKLTRQNQHRMAGADRILRHHVRPQHAELCGTHHRRQASLPALAKAPRVSAVRPPRSKHLLHRRDFLACLDHAPGVGG
ncbi:MAG: hypothetical protein WBX30_03345, partial [Stellaceae bacterium]